MSRRVLVVSFVCLLLTACLDEEVVESTTTVRRTTTTTTTTLFFTSEGLPIIDSASEVDDIKLLQQVLASHGYELAVDGDWGEQTESALADFREKLDLSETRVADAEFWSAAYSAPIALSGAEQGTQIKGFSVPAEFLLRTSVDLVKGEERIYWLPYGEARQTATSWMNKTLYKKDIGSWRWCDSDSVTPYTLRYFWYQRPSRMVGFSLRDIPRGRYQVEVTIEENASLEGCEGTARYLTDVSVDSSRYTYKDCNVIDYCWRPSGSYKNTAEETSVTYGQLMFTIFAGTDSISYIVEIDSKLRPGRSKNLSTCWFLLRFADSSQGLIGSVLGSDYVRFVGEAVYLEFDDGTTVGQRYSDPICSA